MASVERTWNHGIQRGHGIRSFIKQKSNRREERISARELRYFLVFGEPAVSDPAKKRKLINPRPEDIAARIREQDQRYIELEATGRLTASWLRYGSHHKARILAKMHQIRNRQSRLTSAAEAPLPARIFP